MSGRCVSCNNPLAPHELFRTVELEDGTTKEIQDDTCNRCIQEYVRNIDNLDYREYAHEHLTEYGVQFGTNFKQYSE